MVTKRELKDSLEYLRDVVKCKTFDELPGVFKEIESVKMRIKALDKE